MGRALWAALLVATTACTPALATTVTATDAGVTATATYDENADAPSAPMTEVSVTGADGVSRTFTPADLPVGSFGNDPSPWNLTPAGRPLQVSDLDGDGSPEVVVNAYWNGAHCCFLSAILHRSPGGPWATTVKVWGNSPALMRDDDRDGIPEFVGRDDRFAYAFSSYAGSAPPVRVWHFKQGTFRDVTRSYPRYANRELPVLWRDFLRVRRRGYESGGVMAGYIATASLVNRRPQAVARVRATNPNPRQVRAILRKLNAWGYR